MTRWWRSHSVRLRLTLWYVAAMVVVLGVYAALVFAFVSRNASASLDSRLRGDFQWASAMVDQTPEGGITWYEMEELTEEERPWLQVWSADGQLLYQNFEAQRASRCAEARELAQRPDDSLVAVEAADGAGPRADAARPDRRQARSSSRSRDRKRRCAASCGSWC